MTPLEEKIIDLLARFGKRRLFAYKKGRFLIISKRGEYGKEIFLKVKEISFLEKILKKEIKVSPRENLFLLFVNFNLIKEKLVSPFFLIPSLKIKKIKKEEIEKFKIKKEKIANIFNILIENPKAKIFRREIKRKPSLRELKIFLIEARKNIYQEKLSPQISSLGSVEFSYQKNDLSYQNSSFLGKFSFSQRETLFFKGKAIWAISYFGKGISEIEKFLKEALFNLVDKVRLGKGGSYSEDDFLYESKEKGSFRFFYGKERIFKGKEVIYFSIFGGGLL